MSTPLPHEVVIDPSQHHEAETWCWQHLGPRWEAFGNKSGRWACFWEGRRRFGGYRYHFADEQDATIFALRWS